MKTTQAELDAAARRLRDDLLLFAETVLQIRDKSGAVVPLQLNTAQLYVHRRVEEQREREGRVRAIVLKARQQGISTYVQARFFHRVALRRGSTAIIIAHEQLASDHLFSMAQRYLAGLPHWITPSTAAANAREMRFGALDSGYRVLTAGSRAVGRSATAQLLHGSEVAYWDDADEHLAGIGQVVAQLPGTEVILESTAAGVGGSFHRLWQDAVAGRGDYQAIFVPWYWQQEYARAVGEDWSRTGEEDELAALYRLTDDQLCWRRAKIESEFLGDVSRFRAEYPATAEEAFQAAKRETFVSVADVTAARTHVMGEPSTGPLVLGVDPARFGDDRTAFCWRRGRVLTKLEAREKLDLMQVAGLVVQAIRTTRPVRVFIDVVGLGAGLVDRLVELGYGDLVVPVNGGERAQDPDRHRNRRAECWSRMREWLRERPVSIPDHDALAQDLLQPGYSYDSSGRLQIEGKDQIRKRGAPSPDLADALALTFAELLAAETDDEPLARRSAVQAPAFPMADAIGY